MPTKPYLTEAEVERAKRLRSLGFTHKAIAERLNRSVWCIAKLERRGWKRADHNRLPVPPDFRVMRLRMNVRELCQHYDTGPHQIARWNAECGFKREDFIRKGHVSHRRRPCPPDFAELFPKLGFNAATTYWRCSTDAIARWKAECGMEMPARARIAAKRAKVAAPSNDVMVPPPGYEAIKAKLGRVRHMYEVAA